LWAKLAPGEAATNLRVSLQSTVGGTSSFITAVPNTAVTANAWAQLSAPYTVSSPYDSLSLYVESSTGTASFYIDDFQLTFIPPVQIQTDIPSVYETLSSYFPVGAAIYSADITGVHAQLLTKHFNDITAENDMKWSSTEPSEGNFTFAAADALVNFAVANKMLIRGHNMVWDSQIPSWVFLDASGKTMTPTPENRALLIQRMQNHIRGVATHFGSNIYAWDVVNEPIDTSQPDGLRHSMWYQIIGPEYIDIALQTARQFAPNAELFINDYDTTNPARRTALYNLVSGLKSRGVPIDGIGHEMHNNVSYPSAQSVIDTINLFSDLGLDNEITELDISVYTNSTTVYTTVPDSVLAQQAYRYRDYFKAFRQLKGKISSVTFWGIADDHTWLDTFPITRLDLPLLFDTNLQAKWAYWGVVDPSQLPGSALTGEIESKSGPPNSRVWTITLTNPGPGTAYSAQITAFGVTPIGTPDPACNPKLTGPTTFPIVLGDIAAGGSANVPFTIDFTGCPAPTRFALTVPYNSTGALNTGSIIRNNEFR
jgi:endo-1,4-beta-xylanase